MISEYKVTGHLQTAEDLFYLLKGIVRLIVGLVTGEDQKVGDR